MVANTARQEEKAQAVRENSVEVAEEAPTFLDLEMPADEGTKMVVNADADGLISAALLSKAGIEVAGYLSSGNKKTRPFFAATKNTGSQPQCSRTVLKDLWGTPDHVMAVDLMSPKWFSLTNHVIHFGDGVCKTDVWSRGQQGRLLAPSYSHGIAASKIKDCEHSVRNRYPLGTAQMVLAWLARHERLEDCRLTFEQLILIANCDSGLESAWKGEACDNALDWWSKLEQAVTNGRNSTASAFVSSAFPRVLNMSELRLLKKSFKELREQKALNNGQLTRHNILSLDCLKKNIRLTNAIFDSQLPDDLADKTDLESYKRNKNTRVVQAKMDTIAYSWHCEAVSARFQGIYIP